MKRGAVVILGVLPLLFIVGLVMTVLLLLGPATTGACVSNAGPGGPPTGNLGGVQGTGITPGELAAVRSNSAGARRFVGGLFASTAYGPPWGVDPSSRIDQGAGIATAGGLRLNGGAPRKYFVAVDPSLISLGQLIYAWPNPFGWRGAFLAADTGGLVKGKEIDFYDWRGRDSQLGWSTPTEVSDQPISPLGPAASPADTTPSPSSAAPIPDPCAGGAAAGSLGQLSGTPQEIVERVVSYAHDHGFPDVTPASVTRANATHGPTIADGLPITRGRPTRRGPRTSQTRRRRPRRWTRSPRRSLVRLRSPGRAAVCSAPATTATAYSSSTAPAAAAITGTTSTSVSGAAPAHVWPSRNPRHPDHAESRPEEL